MISAPTHVEPGVDSSKSSSKDVRLRNSAKAAPRATGYGSLITIECDVHEGLVTLSGRVPSFYMKQVAQNAVMNLGNLNGIENRLCVEN